MSNKDIQLYIGTQFPNFEIKWINDSSCTLKLQSEELAEQLFKQFSVRPAALIQRSASNLAIQEEKKGEAEGEAEDTKGEDDGAEQKKKEID